MSRVDYRGLGVRGLGLLSAGLATVLVACSGGTGDPAHPEALDAVEQTVTGCSFTVVTSTYVGAPDYWGTIKLKNTGTTALTQPQITFTVPTGVTCDYDDAGWKHTQTGAVCAFTRTSSLTIAAGATYTFQLSTDSAASFTPTSVQLGDPSCSTGTGVTGGTMTTNQKKVAEAMTSVWENDTPKIDYAYAENINDGRGYTSGRAGFCTGTGDAILVIDCYGKLRTAANGNVMAKYMPALVTINNNYQSTGNDQGSTTLLDAKGSWTSDWALSFNNATTRADFKQCQDQVSDKLYYTPTMSAAVKWGLTTALARAALYDIFINHGESGALGLIKATNTALGNSAQTAPVIGLSGITEDAWLKKLLEKRRDTLAADSTWIDAVDRVAGYEKQRRRGNWSFAAAVSNDVRARDCWGTTYPSSGYTVRTINPDATWSTPSTFSYSCN